MDRPIILSNPEEWDFTDYIDSLIQKDEAVDLEFKSAKDGLPNSLWDTYSSFANTDGGVIVLGVKEHKQQFTVEGELFGDKVGSLSQDELTTLVTCYHEKAIANSQLQYVVPMHRSDITRMLQCLCKDNYLISEGNGRGTKYHINEPEEKRKNSESKVGNSEPKVGSSEPKVGSSVKSKNKLSFKELESQIAIIAPEYISLEEIAVKVNRKSEYLSNKIIPKMLANGTIERLYPGVPNHPKQKYKATDNYK